MVCYDLRLFLLSYMIARLHRVETIISEGPYQLIVAWGERCGSLENSLVDVDGERGVDCSLIPASYSWDQ